MHRAPTLTRHHTPTLLFCLLFELQSYIKDNKKYQSLFPRRDDSIFINW